jgi:hypothetical protein
MIKTYVIIAMMIFNFGAGVVNGFYWSSENHNIKAAEDRGFTIGAGVLAKEYICQPVPVFETIEEAKKQVLKNRGEL